MTPAIDVGHMCVEDVQTLRRALDLYEPILGWSEERERRDVLRSFLDLRLAQHVGAIR